MIYSINANRMDLHGLSGSEQYERRSGVEEVEKNIQGSKPEHQVRKKHNGRQNELLSERLSKVE